MTMDASVPKRALDLFDEAMDVPLDRRAAWIAQHCADDVALADELRALLIAADRASGILDVTPSFAVLPDLEQSLTAALGFGYAIQRQIGRGGMATVFLARELKHDRDVVIKVLDSSIAHVFGEERFLREVRIAATLAHPHIVPLIDSGEADGFLYYVMPWMEGETLRARIERGPIDADEGVGILRDIAGALAFAHGAGVVHRDLKPENVLLTAGHAFLLDFGIAKLLDDSSMASSITMPGFPLGTRRYMAPEQAVAANDVDARADIYAMGVMGIELFTARLLPPSVQQHINLSALARTARVPRALQDLLVECVADNPADRPATVADIAQRLEAIANARATPASRFARWAIPTAVVAAVAMIALAWKLDWVSAISGSAGASTLAEPIAVTVLRNETGDSSMTVLGRFAGDWITDALQRSTSVRVVPWSEALSASEHTKRTNAPLVASMREEVRAGTVVTGTFYRIRDSLQLQAQLIDARTERLIASLAPIVVAADRPEDGITQLRDRVLGAVLATTDERLAAVPDISRNPPSFPAYQAFDQGLDHFLGQRYDEALVSLREAFRRDSTFSAPLLLGARAAMNSGEFAVAESLVTKVRAHEAELGTYHQTSLRFIEAVLRGDGLVARAAIQRAALIAPNSRAGYDYAVSLLQAGYARSAQEQLDRMDPDRGEMRGWSSFWTQRAHASHLLKDYRAELRAAREMAKRYPDRRVAFVLEARALASMHDIRRVDSAITVWESLPPDVYWSAGAAMVTAGEQLLRDGHEADGRRYTERGVSWLANRLVVRPTDRGHRYWMGSGLYALARYQEAGPYFESLAREFPDALQFRGYSALVAARRGDREGAEKWLGTAAARDQGEYLVYRARIAAVLGDTAKSVGLLSDAADRGAAGFPWLSSTAFRDFAVLSKDPRARALLNGR